MTELLWWSIARSKELSTWKGIVLVLTAVGVCSDYWQGALSLGIGLVGLLEIVTEEQKQSLDNYDERLNNGG